MTNAKPNEHTLLTKLGLHRVREHLTDIKELGEAMTANAPISAAPCCAWDASSIKRHSASRCPSSTPRVLIDLGGTHTKVATLSATGEWQLLFDYDNEWFENRRDTTLSSIAGFFQVLAREIGARLRSDLAIRVGIIWSNQIRTRTFHTSAARGVTGIVTGLESGGYRKGEWFLRDLKNGDDLGSLLLTALQEQGITAEVLVIGNDTIFTLFATPNAHAGVVMSSGGNCTLIGTTENNKDELFNSELGGMLLMPHQALSEGDHALLAKRGASTLALEELCAGAWFAENVRQHLEVASHFPEGATLQPFLLSDMAITNQALSAYIAGSENLFSRFSPETQALVRSITVALIERASLLTGLLSHLAVIDQVKRGAQKVTISLDSSMARYFPGYLDGIRRAVDMLRPTDAEVSVELVAPLPLAEGSEISVPLQGLARVIGNY